jgi:hypothetical protein
MVPNCGEQSERDNSLYISKLTLNLSHAAKSTKGDKNGKRLAHDVRMM